MQSFSHQVLELSAQSDGAFRTEALPRTDPEERPYAGSFAQRLHKCSVQTLGANQEKIVLPLECS